ncbi:MAG: cytochrome-c peroxidase, partial [Crocinitomicaceae bacterium]
MDFFASRHSNLFDLKLIKDERKHRLQGDNLAGVTNDNPVEMNETLENVIVKLTAREEYTNQFIRAFGSEEITALKISLALENFMLSIVSDDSKYDRYLAGTATLTDSEERGRVL